MIIKVDLAFCYNSICICIVTEPTELFAYHSTFLQGVMCRTLQGHGHWVNTLALNTDYVLRTGACSPEALMKARPELPSCE